jgi:hypothetical protein
MFGFQPLPAGTIPKRRHGKHLKKVDSRISSLYFIWDSILNRNGHHASLFYRQIFLLLLLYWQGSARRALNVLRNQTDKTSRGQTQNPAAIVFRAVETNSPALYFRESGPYSP